MIGTRSVRASESDATSTATRVITGRASTRPASHPTIEYIPGLDGLRAVAVVAVFLFHGGVGWATGGYLAVSTFFTLSGFLITLLLCSEHAERGGIEVGAFWERRIRRLLPAAALGVALAAAVVATAGSAMQRQRFLGDGLATFFDVANWRFVLADQSYGQLFESPSALQHAWSLAIEAQFYWIYPLLFVVVMGLVRGNRRWFGVVLGALFVGSIVLTRSAGFDADRIYYGTDTRAAELLAGALLGLLVASRPGGRLDPTGARARRALDGASLVAFAVLVVAWVVTPRGASWLGSGGLGLYAMVGGVVIAGASVSGTTIGRLLAARPLRSLGRVSYGFYLFHWPILLLLSPERVPGPEVLRLVVAAALTTALAVASYRYVELPVRRRTRPFQQLGLGSLVALCAVVALVPSVVVTLEAPAPQGGDALEAGALLSDTRALGAPGSRDGTGAPAGPAPGPTITRETEVVGRGGIEPRPYRAPSRPLRVVVVGDSVAADLAPLLDSWGREAGVWRVASHARLGCGLLRGGSANGAAGDMPFAPECSAWTEDWPRMLDEVAPDLVILAGGLWDAVDRRTAADDEWRGPGDPVQDRRILDDYRLAVDVLTRTGVAVVWLDHPEVPRDALDASLAGPKGYEPERLRRLDELQDEVVEGRSSVRVVRTMTFLQAWPGGLFDESLRPDGVHFRGAGAAPLVDWLAPEILDAYWSIRATDELD